MTRKRFETRKVILGWLYRIENAIDDIAAASGLEFPPKLFVEVALQSYNRGYYLCTPEFIESIENLALSQELLSCEYRNFCDAGDWLDCYFGDLFNEEAKWLTRFFPQDGQYSLRHAQWFGREPIIEVITPCEN